MMRTLAPLLLAWVIAGCGSSEPSASAARVSPGRDSNTNDDLDQIIRECREASAAARTSGTSDLRQVARVCGRLYRMAECREGFGRAAAGPDESFASSVASACTHAYCPVFSDPKPALCNIEEFTPIDIADHFPEFVRRARERDWPGRADELEQLERAAAGLPIDVAQMDRAEPAECATVALSEVSASTPTANGIQIAIRPTDGDATTQVTVPADVSETVRRMVVAIPSLRGCSNARIEASESIRYDILVQAMDGLTRAGIANVATGTRSAP